MKRMLSVAAVAGISLLCGAAQPRPTQLSEADILRHLPAGARLERPATEANLSRRTAPELVVFYSAPTRNIGTIVKASSHVAVFEQFNNQLKNLWTLDCTGAYQGFFPDTGVYDINKSGSPKIVVDCEGTTVCPNFFGVFEYKEGGIEPVPSQFKPLETCRVEVRDLDGDSIPEIIDYPRAYGTLPRIFRWDGNLYAEDDRRFPRYWSDYGERHFGQLDPSQILPLYVVADYCTLAAKVFALARTPHRARPVCLQARRRILAHQSILEASSPKYSELGADAIRKIDAALRQMPSTRMPELER
ncbi:MAG: hypothetical protein ACYDCG_01640 [Candidatus Acidiferrales bacterium]